MRALLSSNGAAFGSQLSDRQDNPNDLLSRLPTETEMRNPTTPLTPSQQAAFDQLTQGIDDETESITPETAVTLIAEGGFERSEAQELLEQLLLKGYLYESTHGLKITE